MTWAKEGMLGRMEKGVEGGEWVLFGLDSRAEKFQFM